MTEKFSEAAQLFGTVIVFITFFYTSLSYDCKKLFKTENIEGNPTLKKERKAEVKNFILLKWIPLVIFPILLCDTLIIGAIVANTLSLSCIKCLFTNLSVGICVIEIFIFFVYTIVSVVYLVQLFSFLCRSKK